MKRGWIVATGLCGVFALPAAGQEPVAPATQPAATEAPSPLPALAGRPDEVAAEALGPVFSSQAAGISLRPPAGSRTRRFAGGETVVEFVNEAKKLNLRITRTVLSKPVKLTVPADPPTSRPAGGEKERGMLEMSVDHLLAQLPNHKVLRQNVLPLAGHDAGIAILRANVGVQNQFIQQAILQASDQLYYTIFMSSPGLAHNAPLDPPDPAETEAAKLFRAVLESVEILDQEKLRQEQDDRLYRTRALFVNWNEAKFRSVLIPEQWMRVMKDGKDVGYSYIVEEPETRGTTPGLKIGIRSRMMLEPGKQLDGETWYHVSFDRKTENWSSITLVTSADEKFHATEFGSSELRRKAVKDKEAIDLQIGGMNPGVKLVDTYALSVHRVTRRSTAPPFERSLPPYYLPQACGHLLPRLLPLGEAKGFLFASYYSVPTEEVMMRYVDVGPSKEVMFAGQRLNVIPISDRPGYDGTPTVHYVTAAGKYVGSETVSIDGAGVRTVVRVLPTDAATLIGLWKNPDLTAPKDKPEPPGE